MGVNWIGLLIVAAIAIVMIFVRRAGQIRVDEARRLLGEGAVVVDVRTAAEFSNGHLQKAINIPLDEINAVFPRRFPDHDKKILLHCQSGMRSGVARKRLIALGYPNAFNLGSYSRAAQIIKG